MIKLSKLAFCVVPVIAFLLGEANAAQAECFPDVRETSILQSEDGKSITLKATLFVAHKNGNKTEKDLEKTFDKDKNLMKNMREYIKGEIKQACDSNGCNN